MMAIGTGGGGEGGVGGGGGPDDPYKTMQFGKLFGSSQDVANDVQRQNQNNSYGPLQQVMGMNSGPYQSNPWTPTQPTGWGGGGSGLPPMRPTGGGAGSPTYDTSSGLPNTGPGVTSYGQAFNYGVATPETQFEVNRASGLGDSRAAALFGKGDTNLAAADRQAYLNDTRGGVYRQNSAGDYGNQQFDRGQTYEALQRLRDFYGQGPGPSAAEAQLQMAGDQNMANAISLAHSGRGAGQNAAAMRNAMFSNAATQQQLGGQTAMLRAQEAANWRQAQLQAMGLEQNTLGAMRGQDINSMGINSQAGLGYGQLGLGYTQAGMQNQLGWGQLGSQQQMEGERLRQQILGQQLQSNVQIRGQERGFQGVQQQYPDNNNAALWGGLGALAGGTIGLIAGGPAGAALGAGAGAKIGSGAAGGK